MPSRRDISLAKRAGISRQNKGEYDNEKRAKELSRRGFNQEAIAGMMQVSEHEAIRMVDHRTKDIFCDGEL